MKSDEARNIIRALIVLGLVLYGGFKVLCLFDKKETGPTVKCTVAYVTINGKQYDKFITPDELFSDFVTFGDGTRVPRSEVTFKEETFSIEALQKGNEALAIQAAMKTP